MAAALETINKNVGKQFGSAVLAALHRSLPRVMEIYGRLKHFRVGQPTTPVG